MSASLLGLGLLASVALASGFLAIPKCCPLGHVQLGRDCQDAGRDFQVELYSGNLTPSNAEYELVWRPVPCTEGRTGHLDKYWIFDNGTLYRGPNYPLRADYCLEELVLYNGTFPIFCTSTDTEMAYTINAIGYLLSIPLALATLIVYATIKELNTLHGKIVISNMSAFIVCCILLVLTGTRTISPGNTICPYTGYAIQFFFMATFFWLNVMCFDIYWAFSGLKNLTGSVKERETKKLILYSCYAWGLPFLILLVTVGIDYSPYVPKDSIFKPGVGVDKCFFKKNSATGIYFYTPMGIILLINIILFSITAYRICTLRRETAVLKRGDSRKHDNTNDKERFSLYLKLFLVMGINWVMELASFLVGGPGYIWYIPDFTNTLQGVFIFIIFVWKERVRRLVWAKLVSCCGCKVVSAQPRRQWTNGTRHASSLTNSSQITNNSMKTHPNGINGNGAVMNNNGIQTTMA